MAETTENPPLTIRPPELVFPPPHNRVITNVLKLHNNSAKSVAYKVKTTARKRYCVRPNTGIIRPDETVEVQVLLNYTKETQPPDAKKDKFQVQSIYLTPEQETQDLKQVWGSQPEESIIKQKLKCYYTKPSSKNPAASPVFTPTIPPSVGEKDDQDEDEFEEPLSRLSNQNEPSMPFQSPANKTEQQPPSVERSDSDEDKHVGTEVSPSQPASKSSTKSTSERDYEAEIQKLKERIAQYEKEREEVVRQRKVVLSPAPDTGIVATPKVLQQQQKANQSQLMLLLLVALIAFLLGRFL